MTTEEMTDNSNSRFKALIRETSVYKYCVELKENVFTEKGFFDLVKVPDLFITGAGQFLKKLRLENQLSQNKLASMLNVSRSRLAHWEYDRNIPLQSLVTIAESLGISRNTIYWFIDQGKFAIKTVNLPLKFEQIGDIVEYFSPNRIRWTSYITHNCPSELLSKIKATLNVIVHYQGKERRIHSKELYNYLTTFFWYEKVYKIQPPLTGEAKKWHDNGIDLKRAVIIPCLQSDGSIDPQKPKLRFHGKNKCLHDYFIDAMYYEYKELPTSYMQKRKKYRSYVKGYNYVTTYAQSKIKQVVDEIMKLAGNSKTSPARNGQSVEGYLKEPQPHLNYLLNASEGEQQLALRIWASAEGCIDVTQVNYGRNIRPRITICCAHPDLATQLGYIARQCKIHFTKTSGNTWSGINGLYTAAISSCINFLKLGGFIKGVKISANSTYHEGIDKDILFLGILELKKREVENKTLRNLSLREAHNEINKIIENKEYNIADYYINYFS